jgi:hypothetical protein
VCLVAKNQIAKQDCCLIPNSDVAGFSGKYNYTVGYTYTTYT